MSTRFDELLYVEKLYNEQSLGILETYFYDIFHDLFIEAQTRVKVQNQQQQQQQRKKQHSRKHDKKNLYVQALEFFLRDLNMVSTWEPKVVQSRMKQLRDKHPDILTILEELIQIKMRVVSFVICHEDNHERYNKVHVLVKRLFFQLCKTIAAKLFERPGLFVKSDYLTMVKLQHDQKKCIRTSISEELNKIVPVPGSSACIWYKRKESLKEEHKESSASIEANQDNDSSSAKTKQELDEILNAENEQTITLPTPALVLEEKLSSKKSKKPNKLQQQQQQKPKEIEEKLESYKYSHDEHNRKNTENNYKNTNGNLLGGLSNSPIEPYYSLPKHIRSKQRDVEEGFEEVSRTPGGISLQKRKSTRKIKT